MEKKLSKEKPSKLKLSRETLRALEESNLKAVPGGCDSVHSACRPTIIVGGCN